VRSLTPAASAATARDQLRWRCSFRTARAVQRRHGLPWRAQTGRPPRARQARDTPADMPWINRISGALLIGFGLLMITGEMTRLASELNRSTPSWLP
jgi:hypothetical protein